MPIWVRILILLVGYLVFFASIYFYYRSMVSKNKKAEKDKKMTRKDIKIVTIKIIAIVIIPTILIMFFLFPNHIFLSYPKIFLICLYLCIVIIAIIELTNTRKKKLVNAVALCFFVIGQVNGMLFVVSIIDVNSFFSPVKIEESIIDEYLSVGPTIDIYALENDKEYHYSIGYNENTDDYFYYFKSINNGKIVREDIEKENIISKDYTSYYDTKVTIVEVKTIVIKPEYKKDSKYYKSEESKEKYKLLINPNQVVSLKEYKK